MFSNWAIRVKRPDSCLAVRTAGVEASDPMNRRLWPNRNIPARSILAYALVLLVTAYVSLLVMGRVPQNARIDFPTLSLAIITALAAVVLVNPKTQKSFVEIFGRVRSFQIASMRVELAEIRAQQMDQRARLEILGLLLPLVLTQAERSHLGNLYHNTTANYVGNSNLRTELRRLRYLTLIDNPNEPIGTAKDGRTFDLQELVELTPLGRIWAKQIEEMPTGVAIEEQSQEAK
jgi:hypothetical protein